MEVTALLTWAVQSQVQQQQQGRVQVRQQLQLTRQPLLFQAVLLQRSFVLLLVMVSPQTHKAQQLQHHLGKKAQMMLHSVSSWRSR
jgi:hypothetical protein